MLKIPDFKNIKYNCCTAADFDNFIQNNDLNKSAVEHALNYQIDEFTFSTGEELDLNELILLIDFENGRYIHILDKNNFIHLEDDINAWVQILTEEQELLL